MPWYWIVDPQRRSLNELELCDNEYVQLQVREGNESFNPGVFPGLTIDRTEIWPDLTVVSDEG